MAVNDEFSQPLGAISRLGIYHFLALGHKMYGGPFEQMDHIYGGPYGQMDHF